MIRNKNSIIIISNLKYAISNVYLLDQFSLQIIDK